MAELGARRGEQAEQLRHLHRRRWRGSSTTFARVLGDPALPHLFFIDGERLAVENALKVAFDWKSRAQRGARVDRASSGTQRAAPAGRLPRPQRLHAVADQHRSATRSPGSRSSTGRASTRLYLRPGAGYRESRRSASRWRQARAAFEAPPARHRLLHRRADPGRGRRPAHPAAVLRRDARAVRRVRRAAHLRRGADRLRHDRNRHGPTSNWGVRPDVVAFGKKTQVCGVMAGGRVDEVPDNVFRGQLADQLHLGRQPRRHGARRGASWRSSSPTDLMVARRRRLGELSAGSVARRLAVGIRGVVLDARGRGLMCAFSLPSAARARRTDRRLWDRRGHHAGQRTRLSVRFRPALTVSRAEIDAAVATVRGRARWGLISA